MITLSKINFTYINGKNHCRALKNISIAFPDKGLIFLNGESGSGKSTLLKLIASFIAPDSGEMFFNDNKINFLDEKSKEVYKRDIIGYIAQDFNLIDEFNVVENILIANEDLKNNDNEIDELLESVGISDIKFAKINELSGGQKQRVAICRALAKKSQVILCDEPTGALDEITSIEIFEILKKISANKLIIVASHDLESSNKYGDKIFSIEDGIIKNNFIIQKGKTTPTYIHKNNVFSKKHKIAYGMRNLKNKLFRYFVSCTVCILVTTALASIHSIKHADKADTIVESLSKNERDYLICEKTISYLDKDGYQCGISSEFNSFDVQIANNYFNDFGIINSDFGEEIEDYRNVSYYSLHTNRLISVNDDLFSTFGLKMYCGRLPLNTNEISITQYDYEQILYEQNRPIDTNYSSILGSTIDFHCACDSEKIFSFNVVGVVDTRLDKTTYNVSTVDEGKFDFKVDYVSYLNSSLDNVFFCSNDLFVFDNSSHTQFVFPIDSKSHAAMTEKIVDDELFNEYDESLFTEKQNYLFSSFLATDSLIWNAYNGIEEMFSSFSTMLTFLECLSILICFSLFVFYFVTLVVDSKKKSGILLSLGCNNIDLILVSLTQVCVTFLVSSIISALLYFASCPVINLIFSKNVGFPFIPMRINVASVLICFGIPLLITLVIFAFQAFGIVFNRKKAIGEIA